MKYPICFAMLILALLSLPASAASPREWERMEISDDIAVLKISEKAFVHISVTEIPPWGMVSSNGLIVVDNGEAWLFDSPVTDEQTEKLAKWIAANFHAKITAFIPTHWHDDCMGGIEYLHGAGVPSFAYDGTIRIAGEKGLTKPQNGFAESLVLSSSGVEARCRYFGGGHAVDNIAVWIPGEKVLFAGCMVKDLSAQGLGNLSDADVAAWPVTLEKVMAAFPEIEVVIPGHGDVGGRELLNHTLDILNRHAARE